jgi:hypothetical protein
MPGIGDTNRLASLFDHITVEGLVLPSLAAGIPVVSANANWTFGNYAAVVAADVITARYHIHSISVESCTHDGVYQLELYHSAGHVLVSSVRFAVSGGFFGNSLYPVSSALIPPNAQVDARIAYSAGLANVATVGISICYCIEA